MLLPSKFVQHSAGKPRPVFRFPTNVHLVKNQNVAPPENKKSWRLVSAWISTLAATIRWMCCLGRPRQQPDWPKATDPPHPPHPSLCRQGQEVRRNHNDNVSDNPPSKLQMSSRRCRRPIRDGLAGLLPRWRRLYEWRLLTWWKNSRQSVMDDG